MESPRIDQLLREMTLEEKIGQLTQYGPSIVGAFGMSFEDLIGMFVDGRISREEFHEKLSGAQEDLHEEEIRAGQVGSMSGVVGAEKSLRLQRIAVEESRLGIPLLFGQDVIHGLRTVFPIPLGESCAWDMELVEECAAAAAKEATASGIHWTFAPMLDVARDARWGRISEGGGEDPYLLSCIARAKIAGFQGGDLSQTDRLIACAKHLAAYGACESGRDYNTAEITERTLREVYLLPFRAAIDAGCETIMPAFNDISGVPCTANHRLLTEIVRGEYGFEGLYISDANAIPELINHGICSDSGEAVVSAMNAGLEVGMNYDLFHKCLPAEVAAERMDIAVLDRAVARILRLKERKGLFENPYCTDAQCEQDTILSQSMLHIAQRAAERAIVLLKNDGVLPLNGGEKLLLIGKLADDGEAQIGAWANDGHVASSVTIYQALLQQYPNLTYLPVDGMAEKFDSEQIQSAAAAHDIVLACVGEPGNMSGEASSRSEIELPGCQNALLRCLHSTGKPVVALLMNGRPLALPWEKEHLSAIVELWHGGTMAGPAAAAVLTGKVNPSGKLTTTFPHTSGQCPMYYNHRNTGRPAGAFRFTSKFIDAPISPVFPFGFGLSYTTFAYSDLEARIENGKLIASVTVTNIGACSGREIVQLYTQTVPAQIALPAQELRGFTSLTLDAGANMRTTITVDMGDLCYLNASMELVSPTTGLCVMMGGSSVDYLELKLKLD